MCFAVDCVVVYFFGVCLWFDICRFGYGFYFCARLLVFLLVWFALGVRLIATCAFFVVLVCVLIVKVGIIVDLNGCVYLKFFVITIRTLGFCIVYVLLWFTRFPDVDWVLFVLFVFGVFVWSDDFIGCDVGGLFWLIGFSLFVFVGCLMVWVLL